jgi:hypothetical protein
VEETQKNNPFTGSEWEGWEFEYNSESESLIESWCATKGDGPGGWLITDTGELWQQVQIGQFPTIAAARQVVEMIEAAEAGQAIPSRKDVAELVEIGASLCAQLEENWENPSGALVFLAEIKEKYAL